MPASRGLFGDCLDTGYGFRGYGESSTYGISLVDLRWFEALLAGTPLRIESYRPRNWDNHQDCFVMRRVNASASSYATAGPAGAIAVPHRLQEFLDVASFPGFDEGWYRRTYADVAAALRDGRTGSGLAHFLAHGWREGRQPYDLSRAYSARTPPQAGAWVEGRAPP